MSSVRFSRRIDGAQHLWESHGFWRTTELRTFYRWHPVARVIVWALAVSLVLAAFPLTVIVAGLVVFPLDFVLKMIGVGGAVGLVDAYVSGARAVSAPNGTTNLAASPRLSGARIGRGRRRS